MIQYCWKYTLIFDINKSQKRKKPSRSAEIYYGEENIPHPSTTLKCILENIQYQIQIDQNICHPVEERPNITFFHFEKIMGNQSVFKDSQIFC